MLILEHQPNGLLGSATQITEVIAVLAAIIVDLANNLAEDLRCNIVPEPIYSVVDLERLRFTGKGSLDVRT